MDDVKVYADPKNGKPELPPWLYRFIADGYPKATAFRELDGQVERHEGDRWQSCGEVSWWAKDAERSIADRALTVEVVGDRVIIRLPLAVQPEKPTDEATLTQCEQCRRAVWVRPVLERLFIEHAGLSGVSYACPVCAKRG